jgi:hypothetical protein
MPCDVYGIPGNLPEFVSLTGKPQRQENFHVSMRDVQQRFDFILGDYLKVAFNTHK